MTGLDHSFLTVIKYDVWQASKQASKQRKKERKKERMKETNKQTLQYKLVKIS
jgi:hypothetical protein